nr:hypothetical protein [Tanacetum cinerariifolium]
AKTVNGEVQLQALVDGKKLIITESTIRRDLQLEDAKGVDCLSNAAIFEQLTLMGWAVNEEMDNSLERAATTATSLNAEQDKGNIFKTQSKATPNELGLQGTSSGGGPRCQETMGDTVAQTSKSGIRAFREDLNKKKLLLHTRMRMEQYIQMVDYSLWEVIENGNAPLITKVVEGVETTITPATAEEKAQRMLKLKARS